MGGELDLEAIEEWHGNAMTCHEALTPADTFGADVHDDVTRALKDIPALVAEVRRLREERDSLACAPHYVAKDVPDPDCPACRGEGQEVDGSTCECRGWHARPERMTTPDRLGLPVGLTYRCRDGLVEVLVGDRVLASASDAGMAVGMAWGLAEQAGSRR